MAVMCVFVFYCASNSLLSGHPLCRGKRAVMCVFVLYCASSPLLLGHPFCRVGQWAGPMDLYGME